MSGGTTLALPRRQKDARFRDRYFVGNGIDIGAGDDPLGHQLWPNCHVQHWDVQDGDAVLMEGVGSEVFDFVYSSHCLEHLTNPSLALSRWWDILKPGGHMIVVVPDFNMYERGIWPSRIHGEFHKTMWSWQSVANEMADMVCWGEIVKVETLDHDFKPHLPISIDQTEEPWAAECAIEAIVRKAP